MELSERVKSFFDTYPEAYDLLDDSELVKLYELYTKMYEGNYYAKLQELNKVIYDPEIACGLDKLPHEVLKNLPGRFFMDVDTPSKVVITQNMEDCGSELFYKCTAVEEIEITSNQDRIPSRMFFNCTNLKSVKLSKPYTLIAGSAFSGCRALESFEFPDSLEVISSYGFYETGLKNITVPECSVRDFAFAKSALESVTCGANVLFDYAFGQCANLTSFTITNPDVILRRNPFDGCMNLHEITFEGTKAQWIAAQGALKLGKDTGIERVICTKERKNQVVPIKK